MICCTFLSFCLSFPHILTVPPLSSRWPAGAVLSFTLFYQVIALAVFPVSLCLSRTFGIRSSTSQRRLSHTKIKCLRLANNSSQKLRTQFAAPPNTQQLNTSLSHQKIVLSKATHIVNTQLNIAAQTFAHQNQMFAPGKQQFSKATHTVRAAQHKSFAPKNSSLKTYAHSSPRHPTPRWPGSSGTRRSPSAPPPRSSCASTASTPVRRWLKSAAPKPAASGQWLLSV